MGKKKIAEQSAEASLKEKANADSALERSGTETPAKKSKRIEHGRVYINSSYNNTTVTVTDRTGNVLAWASAGSLGFSGPKKATPFASSRVVAALVERLKATAPASVEIIVKGVGGGRDSAIRSLINQGFNVTAIKDATPVPHNGPRPRKIRRV